MINSNQTLVFLSSASPAALSLVFFAFSFPKSQRANCLGREPKAAQQSIKPPSANRSSTKPTRYEAILSRACLTRPSQRLTKVLETKHSLRVQEHFSRQFIKQKKKKEEEEASEFVSLIATFLTDAYFI